MAENTDLIKQKLEIKDFIAQYVALKPAGRNLKGLCPFHKEKSPSFMVNPERQIWHCFGCGKGGDIFAFLMQYENLEFIEALKVLADRAGVELKQVGTSDQKKYETLYEINRIAKDYFRSSLNEPAGAPALKYLQERGLKPQTIEEFELGVALPGNDSLMRHLTKLGYSVADIERAGVVFKSERGMYYDRFRNRIMFPLHNHFGKVIGFTGRVMPGNENEQTGKYVNSPETPIFQKSKLLFGFWKTKGAVRDLNQAVLVEGQMDFLMAYQDGVKNLVATSGTALTDEHLKLIRRLAENLVLSFDNDNAGKAAAERTIDLAQANDFNVKVITFEDPNLKDPADIARAKPGHFAELVKKAVPAMEYYFSYYGIDRAGDIALRKKAIRSALTKIKAISSAIEQQHWLQLLANRTRMPESALSAEMSSLKIAAVPGAQVTAPASVVFTEQPQSRLERIIRRILSISLRDKAVLQRALSARPLFPDEYQKVLEYCAHEVEGNSTPTGPLSTPRQQPETPGARKSSADSADATAKSSDAATGVSGAVPEGSDSFAQLPRYARSSDGRSDSLASLASGTNESRTRAEERSRRGAIADSALPPELIGFINLMYLESGSDADSKEIDALFLQLEKEGRQYRRKELQQKISQAEASGNQNELTKLMEEYKKLAAE